MALLRCDVYSACLGMETTVQVVLPDKGAVSDARLVYLLHGLTDNSTAWQRYSRAESYAAQYGAALVCPEVQRSFYTDMYAGANYFTYITEELPAICRRLFGVTQDANKTYVMGLSMGGYGALKAALRFPQQYAGCAAFSAVTDVKALFASNLQQLHTQREDAAIFGPTLLPPPEDELFALVENAILQKKMPRTFLCCGSEDSLVDKNRRFRDTLTALGGKAAYCEWPGTHNWEFWDEALRQAFAFHFTEKP